MAVLSPDGKHFLHIADSLYSADERKSDICRLDGIERRKADFCRAPLECDICTRRIFLIKDDGTLSAQAFEPERLTLIGEPVQVFQPRGRRQISIFPSGFSISNTGLLAFQSTNGLATRMTWMNAGGEVLDELPHVAYSDPSISPDGRFAAVSCDELHDGKLGICVYDVAHRVTARLTKGRVTVGRLTAGRLRICGVMAFIVSRSTALNPRSYMDTRHP